MEDFPSVAYVINPESGLVCVVKRGVSGYWPVNYIKAEDVHMMNEKIGVTPEMAEAMLAGSMFGWDCPAAKVKGE